jgi:MFS family permease
MPASRFADDYGAKLIFGLSIAIPSLLTLLVPLACRHSFGMALLIRVLIGFFESASFPALYHFFPIWIPTAEKTFMIPFIVSGLYLGEIIGFSISGALAASTLYINGDFYGGWQSIFYVFGLLGLVWYPLWLYAACESPAVHPSITAEEVALINKGTRPAHMYSVSVLGDLLSY